MQVVTVVRAIAGGATILVLAAHLAGAHYSVLLTCGRALELFACDGQCTVTLEWTVSFVPKEPGWPRLRLRLEECGGELEWLCRDFMYGPECVIIIFPVWFAAVPWALLAVVCTAYLRWRRRRAHCAQCVRCGYNLTGNVSGVCPECGGVVSGRVGQPQRATEVSA